MSMKYIAIILVTALVSAGAVYAYMDAQHPVVKTEVNGEEKTIGSVVPELMKDIEYYRNIAGYLYLLDQDAYDEVTKFGSELEDNQDLTDYVTLIYTEALFNYSPNLDEKIKAAIGKVKENKTEEEYFNENTSCAGLIQGIKTEIEARPGEYYGNDVSEEFETIFYSPTQSTCIYITNYVSYDYSDGYDSETYKRVYNANTGNLIKAYKVYSSKDGDDSGKEKESTKNTREIATYILENSNYNVKLFDDISYVYNSI